MHEKTEGAFVRAMTAAKWPTHYFGMDSLSGPSRSLFFVGYPSFEALGEGQPGHRRRTRPLNAAMDRAASRTAICSPNRVEHLSLSR